MLARYRCQLHGKSIGPLSQTQVIELIRSDAIDGETPAQKGWLKSEVWQPLAELPEFAVPLAQAKQKRDEAARQVAIARQARIDSAKENAERVALETEWKPFYRTLYVSAAAAVVISLGLVILMRPSAPKDIATPTASLPTPIPLAEVSPPAEVSDPEPTRSAVTHPNDDDFHPPVLFAASPRITRDAFRKAVAVTAAASAIDATPPPIEASSDSADSGPTVYVTKTGKKYHGAGCRALSAGSTSISLAEAQRKGYSACSTCGGHDTHETAQSAPSQQPKAAPDDPTIHTGPKGGRYHYSKSGKKVYERKR